MDSGEKGMNPVTMTFISPKEKYQWAEPGIEPTTHCFQVLYAMGLGTNLESKTNAVLMNGW